MRIVLRAFFVLPFLSAPACGWLPDIIDLDLAAMKRSLSLEVTQVTPLEREDVFFLYVFNFKLSNHGASTITACEGPSRSISYTSSGAGGADGTSVDHPGCVKEFTLQPRGAMTWREEIKVPTVLTKGASVDVEIEIVNPKRCGGLGCSATRLESNSYVVP